jgi:hypothetical protein
LAVEFDFTSIPPSQKNARPAFANRAVWRTPKQSAFSRREISCKLAGKFSKQSLEKSGIQQNRLARPPALIREFLENQLQIHFELARLGFDLRNQSRNLGFKRRDIGNRLTIEMDRLL